MSHCPAWIYDAVSAQIANEFIAQEMPLRTIAKKYSDGLAEKYAVITVEELEDAAEEFIRALDEVKVESEAIPLLNSYCFFRIMYESNNVKRKMKPLFGAVDAPVAAREYSPDIAIKRFKAYLFSLRSSVAVQADPGWKLSTCDDLPFLRDIAAKSLNILDIL
jgi:hypothetical protein